MGVKTRTVFSRWVGEIDRETNAAIAEIEELGGEVMEIRTAIWPEALDSTLFLSTIVYETTPLEGPGEEPDEGGLLVETPGASWTQILYQSSGTQPSDVPFADDPCGDCDLCAPEAHSLDDDLPLDGSLARRAYDQGFRDGMLAVLEHHAILRMGGVEETTEEDSADERSTPLGEGE